jgi:cytochrome c-type biogenesis protein
MGLAGSALSSFSLGLATPLTAVCVIPLYPGFLAYLSNQGEGRSVAALAGLVALGVLAFMTALGLVFTTLLSQSLTVVTQVVSPVAFALLAALSLVLLSGRSFGGLVPAVEPPTSSHPSLSAFGYGAFFGAIVLPCNPGFIAVFFARSFLFTDPVASMANFLAFGVGLATPLLLFAVVADSYRTRVLGLLTRHEGLVNRATGAVMLAVSLYYLVVVFEVFGPVV